MKFWQLNLAKSNQKKERMLIGEKFLKGHKWNEAASEVKANIFQVHNNKQIICIH